MPPSSSIQEFVDRAKAAGTPDESIVGILSARGWPEKAVHEALAAFYERAIGIQVPRRDGGPTAAKDAFFYLLIFATLATWTIGIGSLAFTLIERWLPDTLFSGQYYEGYESSTIAGSLSAVIVAFPIFLLISWKVLRDAQTNPEKLNSPVRKWLTYMALVIAAGVFIGDLIAVLEHFLRGEITSRFLAEALVVLVISGGVFFYYFGGLRKSDSPGAGEKTSRDAWMAGISSFAVLTMVVLGFFYIGAPSTQRLQRADQRRVRDISQLATGIVSKWSVEHKLPASLDEIPTVAVDDPVTRRPYEYRAMDGSDYEICATFSQESLKPAGAARSTEWDHPAGHFCYQMDAAKPKQPPPYFYPDF